MATKLNKFDFSVPSSITTTEKAVYPWDEWLDGDIWQIEQGEDFETHPLMMERIIRTRATARGAKVSLRHQANGNDDAFGVIIMQRTDIKGPKAIAKEERTAKREKAKAEAAELVANLKRPSNGKPSKRAPKKLVSA